MKRFKTFLITALAGIIAISAFAASNTTRNVSVKFDVSKLAIKEVVNADDSLQGQHSPSKDAYRPFVEPGKRWNVVMYYSPSWAFWPPRDQNNELDKDFGFAFMYYEIGDPVEIEGKTYCPIYCCPDIEKEDAEENVLMGYLREDCDLRQVWFNTDLYHTWEGNILTSLYQLSWTDEYPEEILLYDFSNMYAWTYNEYLKWYFNNPAHKVISTEAEFNDGLHKGFKTESQYIVGMYEGIGAVEIPESWDHLQGHEFSDPFGCYYSDITGGHNVVLLCSVIAPDGNTILDIKMHDDILHWHEMLGIDANESTGANVWVEGNILKITAPGAIGQITVTDMTGRVVISTQAESSSIEIPLRGVARGIYVVKTDTTTRKIAVN